MVDGPATTFKGLQKENVALEEARQILDEVDFRTFLQSKNILVKELSFFYKKMNKMK